MAQRAYRVIKIETKPEASLNLSHQIELTDFLGEYTDDGMFEVSIEKLGELLDSKELQKKYDVEQEQLKSLQDDYDNAYRDEEYISYMAW